MKGQFYQNEPYGFGKTMGRKREKSPCRAICAFLTGRTSNPDYADIAISTIVSEAIHASNLLINELWKELPPPTTHMTAHSQPLHTLRAPSTFGKLSSIFEMVATMGTMHIKIGPVSK